MAWTDDKRARLDRLKGAEARGALFDDERAELAALLCELDREEAAALAGTPCSPVSRVVVTAKVPYGSPSNRPG